MQILAIRPETGGRTLARFDLQLVDGVRLYNIALKERPDGQLRVFAPSAFGSAAATFTTEIAEQIVRAASDALGENRVTVQQPEIDTTDFSWTNLKRITSHIPPQSERNNGPWLPLPPGENIKAVMTKYPLVSKISEKAQERIDARREAAEAAAAAEAEPAKATATTKTAKKPITATAFQLRDPASLPEREWLFARHYIRKYATASVGPGGGGKTAHSISETLAMVTGHPLLDPDGPLTKPLRVWWINAEDPQDEIDRRFHAAAKHFSVTAEKIGGRLFTDSGRDQEFVIARTEGRDLKIIEPFVAEMVEEIKRREIDVVIVDPFVSTHEAQENDNSAMQRVTAAWVRVADEANCGVELVHHVAKNQGEVTADSARGGGAFKDKVRSMRVFNAMTPAEGDKCGVDDPRAYFRLDMGKVNMVASGRSQWRRFVSVPLGNGRGFFKTGDEIGVVEPWRWPSQDTLAERQAEARMSAVAEVPVDTLAGLKVRLGAAAYKADQKGKPWAGDVVMELTGVTDRKEAKAMLDAWVEMGELEVVEEYDQSTRKPRNFVKPATAPT